MMRSEKPEQRWEAEASFFDAHAATVAIAEIDPVTVARYSGPLRNRFRREFCISLLGDLRGKTVLDLGCGEGGNSILLAKLGAQVTGVDISPKAIEVAQQRAIVNGVQESAKFICSPIELLEKSEKFDVIFGDAILHHLIESLDSVLSSLLGLAHSGSLLVFSEPINFNQAFRKFRLMLPIHTEATPDERPLERTEIKIMKAHMPFLQLKRFDLLGRLNRFVLTDENFEKSSSPRRMISSMLASLDAVALAIPGVRDLASRAIIWAKIP